MQHKVKVSGEKPTRPALCARLIGLALGLLVALAPLPAPAAAPVDLNSATLAELMELPAIGKHRAEEILRFRQVHGFQRPADLLRIKGIGRRTYFKLKPLVQVRPAAPPTTSAPATPQEP